MADQRKYELWGLHLSGEYLWRQTDYLQIAHSPLGVGLDHTIDRYHCPNLGSQPSLDFKP